MPPEICLIEDDPIMGESLKERLILEEFSVDWFECGADALEQLQQRNYSAVVSDIHLPDITGDELFFRMTSNPQTHMPPTIFITGFGSIESAVELLKLGAVDYMTKPLDPKALVEKLRRLCRAENNGDAEKERLGLSPAIQRLASKLPAIARHPKTPVLITGESGSGKEVIARRVHLLSKKNSSFIAVNCAAISENLIESELFGYEKGAFTGAGKIRRGVFEQAEGGILFLDEIGDMPLPMQAKLLRAIQERAIMRVGGEQLIHVDFRLICATHCNLMELVRKGHFREDLYYRINVIELIVPPLRERLEDVIWLAERFIAQHVASYPDEQKVLDTSAREALLAYQWPGNVRELKHAIERVCIMAPNPSITAADLSLGGSSTSSAVDTLSEEASLQAVSSASERTHIIATLETHEWRMAESASALCISRKTLWQKMKKLGIQRS